MAFTAIESDTDLLFKEYGLPDRSRERESEEEEDSDGDDSEISGWEFGFFAFLRPGMSRDPVSVANPWLSGDGPSFPTPHLRC